MNWQGVHLFGATWCHSCPEVKKSLQELDIAFTYHDVEAEKITWIKSVPQLYLDGRLIAVGAISKTQIKQKLEA